MTRPHACSHPTILVDEVDGPVWDRIVALRTGDWLERALAAPDATDDTADRIAALDARIADLDDQRSRLVKRVAATTDDDLAAALMAEAESLSARRREAIAHSDAIAATAKDGDARKRRAANAVRRLRSLGDPADDTTFAEKRRVLSELGAQVVLSPNSTDDIRWRLRLTFGDAADPTWRGGGAVAIGDRTLWVENREYRSRDEVPADLLDAYDAMWADFRAANGGNLSRTGRDSGWSSLPTWPVTSRMQRRSSTGSGGSSATTRVRSMPD